MAWLWLGFLLLVFAMLALDLGVFHRDDRAMRTREALLYTSFWITLSLLFGCVIFAIYHFHWFGAGASGNIGGKDAAILYLTGYVVEESLSLDNIFVIALVLAHFRVPSAYQHRVLFWGVLGALIMRGAMIGAGAALIRSFSWAIYVFGGFLLLTAIRMIRAKEEEVDPTQNILVRAARRVYPMTDKIEGHDFFVRRDGRWAMTPLFLVLLVVESTDILFAVDSIPAIFGVTDDPFIIFTSNIFAILGLRTLYFALVGLLDKFRYLKQSLVFVLAYVGLKMILSHQIHVPALASLGVICGILGLGVVASMLRRERSARVDLAPEGTPAADDEASPADLPETPRRDLSP
jgi:TerC family integral membrane protein